MLEQVLRAVAAPPPSATELDMYLYNVARSYNVHWLPDLSPQQKYVWKLYILSTRLTTAS